MEIPFCLLEAFELFDHDDGLKPPTSRLDAAAALIFLLLDSNSNCLLDKDELDGPENIEPALIKARLSFLLLSNLEENFTRAAAATSSLEAGSRRMPRPFFLEAASSSATLLF